MLLTPEEAKARVLQMLPKGWTAEVDHEFLWVSNGRVNGKECIAQTYVHGKSGYDSGSLARDVDEALAEIKDRANIEGMSVDDCLLAVAEYNVEHECGVDRGMADSYLMDRALCSKDTANEALEHHSRENLWEYGVSARTSWLTREGFARLAQLSPKLAANYKYVKGNHVLYLDPDGKVKAEPPPATSNLEHTLQNN